jgi:hypothetical protein
MRVRKGLASVAFVVAGAIAASAVSAPSAQADGPTPASSLSDRSKVLALWRTGGSSIHAAAERALLGTDTDIQAFLTTGQAQPAATDTRISVDRMLTSAVCVPKTTSMQFKRHANTHGARRQPVLPAYRKLFDPIGFKRLAPGLQRSGPRWRLHAVGEQRGEQMGSKHVR